jgi:hypothetical protein
MPNENSKLNKDFTLSHQADEAQKSQEAERQKRIEAIKNDKERQQIKQMVQTRDKEMQRDIRLKQEEQQKAVRDETQKRLDAQRAPSFDFGMIKKALGKSPNMVADKVMAEFKAAHERELISFTAGLATPYNKVIDKLIEKALEQQRQKEAEPTFEKGTSRSPDSSKDAFQKAHDQTGGEKDWRSLKADREAGAKNEPER